MFTINMKKLTLLLSASALVGLLVVPAGASAAARGPDGGTSGANCDYARSENGVAAVRVVDDSNATTGGGPGSVIDSDPTAPANADADPIDSDEQAIVYVNTTPKDGGGGAGSGVSGEADAAAGACVNTNSGAGFEGGTLEAGQGSSADGGGADGVYAIADGDDNNAAPAQGYIGVSNFETAPGTPDGCNQANPDNPPPGVLEPTGDPVEPDDQTETGAGTGSGNCLTLRDPMFGTPGLGLDTALWGNNKNGALLAVSGPTLLVCGDDSSSRPAPPAPDRRWESSRRDGCTGPR